MYINILTSLMKIELLWTLLLTLLVASLSNHKGGERLYVHQFEPGSEHLPMPTVSCYSLYMGKVKYSHMPLLLESMRWNPTVQFNLINILEDDSLHLADDLKQLTTKMEVPNFKVHAIKMSDFRARVKEKLGIDVPFNSTWYYKLCDYKPTMAYLYPELSNNNTYKYWGYADMDIVWGNISRFSHYFQGDYPFVISGWWSTTGAATFCINEDWTVKAFMEDSRYIPLLQNLTYHSLDENGLFTHYIIADGDVSMHSIQTRLQEKMHFKIHRGKNIHDQMFIDEGDSVQWAGPVRWFRGSLQIIHGSNLFPPGRELMFYHRMDKLWDISNDVKSEVTSDMITYGYLLPTFIPLLTRHICRDAAAYGFGKTTTATMALYKPYDPTCFAKANPHHQASMRRRLALMASSNNTNSVIYGVK